jgi:signal-transduction protein with cAMP-binding, CBS, and nucleotidyltransferase domain
VHSLSAIFRHRAHEQSLSPLARIAATETCAGAVEVMAAAGASAALVIDAGGHNLGIVTEQDIVRRVSFRLAANAPITQAMSAPVEILRSDEYVFSAIARMRRRGLRHMPVAGPGGEILGLLELHRAYAGAIPQLVSLIDALAHEETLAGLAHVKAVQVELAQALLAEQLPGPEILSLLSDINRDIHARVAMIVLERMRESGWGDPPVPICLIVMGSAGRGESALHPDQDNGLILDDYPDQIHHSVDAWAIEFATRLTASLDTIGIPLCKGHVMATNPLWRKARTQWQIQITGWMRQRLGPGARLADIFFDFAPVWGRADFAGELRGVLTPLVAENEGFLRDLYDLQADHATALAWFGRIQAKRAYPGAQLKVDLKLRGILPLVDAVRIMALRHGVAGTGTLTRISALAAAKVFNRDEEDELRGALVHMSGLLLREQLNAARAARQPDNTVPLRNFSRRERESLIGAFRSIERLRRRVSVEIGGRAI